jgi:L-asparaginase / beta-aspartyl-peptidase
VLETGGTAVDAIEAAIRVLEEDPTYNSACGSDLNADGEVQMDALIMEGAELNCGGVAAIEGVRHPISVARLVLDAKQVLIAGDGARRFAETHGAELCHAHDLITEEKRKAWEEESGDRHDTVGCVALDASGSIAAGASTGGLAMSPRGRVGDSCMIGCGVYADNEAGGCSMTGDGEEIARMASASSAVSRLRSQQPDCVAKQVVQAMARRVGGEAGCILIDRHGQLGWFHNSANMAVAYRNAAMPASVVYLHKDEEGS